MQNNSFKKSVAVLDYDREESKEREIGSTGPSV